MGFVVGSGGGSEPSLFQGFQAETGQSSVRSALALDFLQ